jgi:argininosuccinate lyase
VRTELQWGGRFADAPDAALLAFGSSLEEDLFLAPFDVAGSRAHVRALQGGGVIDDARAKALDDALQAVAGEIESGSFAEQARASGAEDVHGAIDARVRELATVDGPDLHTGRSRNDQVATALALYARDRAERLAALCVGIARDVLTRADDALQREIVLPATTHLQPAQPILLAFWLDAVAEGFGRAARRAARVAADAKGFSPLGSAACSGTTLPLDRAAAAKFLGFAAPSRNALDAIGDRDLALDLLHAVARATLAASRVSGEIVLWATPAFGFVRLGDAASTGSSLMPQKRNPDPFEFVRGTAALIDGELLGALSSLGGLPLSYHKDLQATKAAVIRGTERGLAALSAFHRALGYVEWNAATMAARAGDGYTVATDIADALIARGVPARTAHSLVGEAVSGAERAGRPLEQADLDALTAAAHLTTPLLAPLAPLDSVRAKKTSGSTRPDAVARSISELRQVLDEQFGKVPA